MNTKGLKGSMKYKLLLMIIFIAIYPIVLVVILGILNYENVVKERFFDTAKSEMELVSNYITQDVKDMDTFMVGLLADQTIYDLINKQDNIKSELDGYNFEREVEAYARSAIASKSDFDVVGMYLYESNQVFSSSKRTGVVLEEDIPFLLMNQAFEGSELRASILTENDIYVGRKILDKDSFVPLGIMMFRLAPEHLSTIVGTGDSNSISTNYLITREGHILANSNVGGHKTMILENELHMADEGNYEIAYGTEEYFVSVSDAPLLDFVLIQLTTKEELLNDLQKVTDLIIILSVVNLPLYILIGNLLYKSIITPVEKLVAGMDAFENGHLDVRIKTRRKDEFGYMIGTFNQMTETMAKLINEVYLEELARKDAEISALQEQINPHFMYNTLESINWRAQLAGQDEIANMIQSLSIMMDASINRDASKLTSLENELFISDQYMYLIQMRFGDKIVYYKDIDDMANRYMVPKLIIQPLLENAVKYGVEPIGRGHISLRIRIEDKMIIELHDNGQGMTEARLEVVRRIFDQEKRGTVSESSHRSIGLRNVARRLHLLFEDEVLIEVDSSLDEGTTFTINIPLVKEEKNEENI